MARPNKHNLKYWPLEVGFWDDHKIVSIEEAARIATGDPKAGIIAGYIAQRIISMVYDDNGYYLEWPENFELTAAKRIGNGITSTEVKTVFEYCLKYKLFNAKIFKEHQVVTSAGIQKRWREVMTMMRRKVAVNVLYACITSEDTAVSSEETPTPATFSTQNEIKGNEIKTDVEATKVAAPGPVIPLASEKTADHGTQPPKRKRIAGAAKMIPPTQDECIEYFTTKCYNPKAAASWMPDTCRREASDFFNHYTANGWRQGKGTGRPIVSWQAAANMWISRARKGTFNDSPGPANKIETPKAPAPASERSTTQGYHRLPSKSQDINYLFEKYLENPEGMTTISIDASYYDHLKSAGIVSFDKDQRDKIRREAIHELEAAKIEITEPLVTSKMKKLGVLTLFRDMAAANKTEIFTLNQQQ